MAICIAYAFGVGVNISFVLWLIGAFPVLPALMLFHDCSGVWVSLVGNIEWRLELILI